MVTNERSGPEETLRRLDRLRPALGAGGGTIGSAVGSAGVEKPRVIIERRPSPVPGSEPQASRVFDEVMGHSTRDARGEVSEPVN